MLGLSASGKHQCLSYFQGSVSHLHINQQFIGSILQIGFQVFYIVMLALLYKSADMKNEMTITLDPVNGFWHMWGQFGVVF